MASKDMFDMYSAPEAPASKKRASRRHHGECSKAPPAKKTRTADSPTDGPSTNCSTTSFSPRAADSACTSRVESTPSPPTPANQTQPAAPAPTWGDISSRALRSAKDRMEKILRHERYREAMVGTDSMDVDQILSRALNKLASAMLTVTAGRLC
ncbi:uncharacterized protein LOC133800960 [Humulus lupulus]|uniref:uncharacterized protein LOC133800960 n=1 Tax=Humulus lupulus TaxID=3486 RepID=UPI002B418265|nr:uncharacterized protein LOC133800960 [Humulus lupulus]